MTIRQLTPAQRARKALILFVLEVSIGAWIGYGLAEALVSVHPIVWAWVYAFASIPVGWEILRAEFAPQLAEGGRRYELGGVLLLPFAMPVGAVMMIPTAILRVRAVIESAKPGPTAPVSFADARRRKETNAS